MQEYLSIQEEVAAARHRSVYRFRRDMQRRLAAAVKIPRAVAKRERKAAKRREVYGLSRDEGVR